MFWNVKTIPIPLSNSSLSKICYVCKGYENSKHIFFNTYWRRDRKDNINCVRSRSTDKLDFLFWPYDENKNAFWILATFKACNLFLLVCVSRKEKKIVKSLQAWPSKEVCFFFLNNSRLLTEHVYFSMTCFLRQSWTLFKATEFKGY